LALFFDTVNNKKTNRSISIGKMNITNATKNFVIEFASLLSKDCKFDSD